MLQSRMQGYSLQSVQCFISGKHTLYFSAFRSFAGLVAHFPGHLEKAALIIIHLLIIVPDMQLVAAVHALEFCYYVSWNL